MDKVERGKQCHGCDEEECLRCSDMVLSGHRYDDSFEADFRRGFRRDGEDPMDILFGRQLTQDQDGLVGTDDIGGLTSVWKTF